MENYYTYNKKRKCLQCQKPIADQAHGITKFCPKVILPDESILSCKDDFHSLKSKVKNLPYKKIADHHKNTTIQIENLFKAKGENVTAELLSIYGIKLNQPVQFNLKDQKVICYFIGFKIEQINSTQFKIFRNEFILR